MKKKMLVAVTICFVLMVSFNLFAEEVNYSTKPVHSLSQTKKWRIGYIQGGDYIDYKQTLLATVAGLMELGWISPFDVKEYVELDGEMIWNSLALNTKNDYLTFVEDAFYTSKWHPDQRDIVLNKIRLRIESKKDIDLVIAMGTWAGQDLAKQSLDTNILVMSASNPIESGIIKTPHESGSVNLHAQVDPTLNERQVRFFYENIKFRKLGIILENSVAGRSYAGIASIESLSKKLGFEIVTCHAASDIADASQCENEYLNCIDKIASKIDALFVTVHGGVTTNSLPSIAKKSKSYHLPTFSQSGSEEVKKGLLMSLSRSNFKKLGLFQAAIIANVFNGAKPGDLTQVFKEPLSISLNIKTAQDIGYMPSADVIAATDILFHDN